MILPRRRALISGAAALAAYGRSFEARAYIPPLRAAMPVPTGGGPPGTFALLTHTSQQGGSAGSGNSSAIDTTGAALIVATTSRNWAASIVFSDSQSNTWTPLTSYGPTSGGGAGADVQFFRCVAPTTSAAHTFAVTGTGSFASLAVAAFSCTTTPSFQAENGAGPVTGGGGSASINTGLVTPSQDNEVLVMGLGDQFATASINIGTKIEDARYIGGVSYGVALAYEIQTTATARNPQWTAPNTFFISANIVAFKS